MTSEFLSSKRPSVGIEGVEFLFWSIVFMPAVVSLFFCTSLYAVFSLTKLTLLYLSTAGLALIWVSRSKAGASLKLRSVDFPLALFFVLAAAAAIMAINVRTVLFGYYGRYEGLLAYCSYLVVFLTAASVLWSKKRLSIIIFALTVAAIPISLYGILQALGIDPIVWPPLEFEARRAFSTFGNPIIFASYLALVWPVCFSLAFSEERRDRIIGGGAALLVGAALMLTYTRAGWIGGAAGVLVFFWLRGDRKQRVAAVAGVAAVGALVGLMALTGAFGSQFKAAFTSRGAGISERAYVWRIAADAARARPLLGYGPDNFRLAFTPRDTLERSRLVGGRKVIDNAHNYPLQLAVTVGIPAALVLYFWLIWLIFLAARQQNADGAAGPGHNVRRIAGSGRDPYVQALIAGVVGYMVSLLFTVNSVGTGALFWLFMGVLRGRVGGQAELPLRLPAPLVVAAKGAAALLAVFLLVWSAVAVTADYRFAASRRLAAAGQIEPAMAEGRAAMALNPFVGKYITETGLLYLNRAAAEGGAQDYEAALSLFEQALVLVPDESDYHMLAGQTLLFYGEQTGDREKLRLAEEHLRRSIKLWPYGASNNYLMGYLKLVGKEDREARYWLDRALAVGGDFPAAEEALAELEKRPVN